MESDNSDREKERRSTYRIPLDPFLFPPQTTQSPIENCISEEERQRRSKYLIPLDPFFFPSSKTIQKPRSIPSSRRNSKDDDTLDALLSAKLSLNDSDSGFRKLSTGMTHQDPMGNFPQNQRTLEALPIDSEAPLFNPLLPQTNESPIRNTVPVATTVSSSEDYSESFSVSNISNLAANSNVPINGLAHSVVSPEMNRPWIPYHTPLQQQQQNTEIEHMVNPFNNDTGHYAYGWKAPTHKTHATATEISNMNVLLSRRQNPRMLNSQAMCPHAEQFGFCPENDSCQYISTPTPFFTSTANSLYQQYNNQQPLPQNPIPFFTPPVLSPALHKTRRQNDQRRSATATNAVAADQDKFADAKIEDFIGKLYELCKDQNGCRFLQKKIEEKENGMKNLQIVFNEIHPHFTELMTDSFGNYLCQKMLERCNNEQRTIIVDTVAPELVKIALNMHGTRAVQKLIEYLSTDEQIKTVTSALNSNVVILIKDLNGNHVIQKCLHRLSAENNQFIYDAVCANCIEVASHKHGCCVLQRCFDHATIPQKDQLVDEIARHALPLVQDPFGNYVVQYVLELGITNYSESVIRRFVNHVCTLSVQKFSSNVIENCIRTAQPPTRRLLIAELVNQSVMEKLLHDSFANYVIQTSLDFADEDQRAELVECIRPLLSTIRTTPYGKRIHSKIFRDTKSNTCTKTQSTQPRQ